MLCQFGGGLRMKLVSALGDLQRRGIDVRLIGPMRERLSDFDLVQMLVLQDGNRHVVQTPVLPKGVGSGAGVSGWMSPLSPICCQDRTLRFGTTSPIEPIGEQCSCPRAGHHRPADHLR